MAVDPRYPHRFQDFTSESENSLNPQPLSTGFEQQSDATGGSSTNSHAANAGSGQRLSLKQQVEIRKVFKVFDGNNSGSICLKELRLAVRALGIDVDQERVRQLVRSMDVNVSGEIELDEFEAIVSAYVSSCTCGYRHTSSSATHIAIRYHEKHLKIQHVITS